jgi:hypothetical protein
MKTFVQIVATNQARIGPRKKAGLKILRSVIIDQISRVSDTAGECDVAAWHPTYYRSNVCSSCRYLGNSPAVSVSNVACLNPIIKKYPVACLKSCSKYLLQNCSVPSVPTVPMWSESQILGSFASSLVHSTHIHSIPSFFFLEEHLPWSGFLEGSPLPKKPCLNVPTSTPDISSSCRQAL